MDTSKRRSRTPAPPAAVGSSPLAPALRRRAMWTFAVEWFTADVMRSAVVTCKAARALLHESLPSDVVGDIVPVKPQQLHAGFKIKSGSVVGPDAESFKLLMRCVASGDAPVDTEFAPLVRACHALLAEWCQEHPNVTVKVGGAIRSPLEALCLRMAPQAAAASVSTSAPAPVLARPSPPVASVPVVAALKVGPALLDPVQVATASVLLCGLVADATTVSWNQFRATFASIPNGMHLSIIPSKKSLSRALINASRVWHQRCSEEALGDAAPRGALAFWGED